MTDAAQGKVELQASSGREYSLEERIRLRDYINKAKLSLISLKRQSETLTSKKERLSDELSALKLQKCDQCEVPAIVIKAYLRLQQLRDEEDRLSRLLDETTLLPEREESAEETSILTDIKQLRSRHEQQMQASFAKLSQLKEEAEILRMLLQHYYSEPSGANGTG